MSNPRPRTTSRGHLVAGAIEGLLVGVLKSKGGGGAILPRLGAEVVVEAGAGGHGLGVEVGGERAVLRKSYRTASANLALPTLPAYAAWTGSPYAGLLPSPYDWLQPCTYACHCSILANRRQKHGGLCERGGKRLCSADYAPEHSSPIAFHCP